MRLGRLAVAGLTAGVVAGFVIALLLPRRRRTVLDLTVHDLTDEPAPESLPGPASGPAPSPAPESAATLVARNEP